MNNLILYHGSTINLGTLAPLLLAEASTLSKCLHHALQINICNIEID